jgi:hypothetical protein
LFISELNSPGLTVNEGKIIDASFVEVSRQRNKAEENERIKEGKGEELWKDKPHKKRHKDMDARWAKKMHRRFSAIKIMSNRTEKVS